MDSGPASSIHACADAHSRGVGLREFAATGRGNGLRLWESVWMSRRSRHRGSRTFDALIWSSAGLEQDDSLALLGLALDDARMVCQQSQHPVVLGEHVRAEAREPA